MAKAADQQYPAFDVAARRQQTLCFDVGGEEVDVLVRRLAETEAIRFLDLRERISRVEEVSC